MTFSIPHSSHNYSWLLQLGCFTSCFYTHNPQPDILLWKELSPSPTKHALVWTWTDLWNLAMDGQCSGVKKYQNLMQWQTWNQRKCRRIEMENWGWENQVPVTVSKIVFLIDMYSYKQNEHAKYFCLIHISINNHDWQSNMQKTFHYSFFNLIYTKQKNNQDMY